MGIEAVVQAAGVGEAADGLGHEGVGRVVEVDHADAAEGRVGTGGGSEVV